MNPRVTRLLTILAACVVVFAAVGTLIGQSGAWWWVGDLCCHWTLHAAIVLIVGAVVWRKNNAISRGCVVLMLVALVPWIRHAFSDRAPNAAQPVLRLAWANLYYFNEHRAEAWEALLGSDADLIGLTELCPDDQAVVKQDARWPYQVWSEGSGIMSCALLSKRRIVTHGIHDEDGHVVISAVVDAGDSPLRVLVTHLIAPLHAVWKNRRDQQFASLARIANQQDLPTVVLGDFNATPATALWRPFLTATGLQPAPGLTPATWPAWSSPWPRCPGIAIDHILVRSGCLTPLSTVSIPGTDHLGLTAGWSPAR